jgi:hypothetical protein
MNRAELEHQTMTVLRSGRGWQTALARKLTEASGRTIAPRRVRDWLQRDWTPHLG